jgi:hypothetical protein
MKETMKQTRISVIRYDSAAPKETSERRCFFTFPVIPDKAAFGRLFFMNRRRAPD